MSGRHIKAKEMREAKRGHIFDNLLLEDHNQRPIGKGQNRRFISRIQPRTDTQANYIAAIDQDDVIFGVGPAGTGKTYLGVALAVDMLAKKKFNKMILSRPAVEAEGERLGFLPGDLKAKIDPYLVPIYDVLYERLGKTTVTKMIDDGIIEVCPLAFMRGRTLDHSIIILDEMQNASEGQLKMALTRIGEGSKAIVTGDPDQIDPGIKSGFEDIIRKLDGEVGISVVRFDLESVVRADVVKRILKRL